jgi:hypothetical protein
MNRIEVNVLTGEQTIVPLTDAEIAEMASRPAPVVQVPVDPVEKLRAFLAANPDVAGLL